MDIFLTVDEVARELRVSRLTIKRLMRKKLLEGFRINTRGDWRIKQGAVEKYLEGINK